MLRDVLGSRIAHALKFLDMLTLPRIIVHLKNAAFAKSTFLWNSEHMFH